MQFDVTLKSRKQTTTQQKKKKKTLFSFSKRDEPSVLAAAHTHTKNKLNSEAPRSSWHESQIQKSVSSCYPLFIFHVSFLNGRNTFDFCRRPFTKNQKKKKMVCHKIHAAKRNPEEKKRKSGRWPALYLLPFEHHFNFNLPHLAYSSKEHLDGLKGRYKLIPESPHSSREEMHTPHEQPLPCTLADQQKQLSKKKKNCVWKRKFCG